MACVKVKKAITNYHDNIICFQKYEPTPPDGPKEDWATAFRNVYQKIEKINHTIYNYSTFSKEIMKGAVNRNTIANWLKGKTLPGHREDVIKLGITAGYSETEMNKLLLAAGKSMLYIRESDKAIVSVFRDAYYIYLTKQNNDSCRKALAVIEMLCEEVKSVKNAGFLLPSDSINEEFIVPYYEDKEMLLQTCRDFYENLYIQFHNKYNLVKGMPKTVYPNEENPPISVDALAGRWKEALNVMLYTAFNVHIGKHIENMHIPQRQEIIILGLILSYTKEDIDDALEDMHYQTLSETNNTVESVLIYVLKTYSKRKVLKNAISLAQYSLGVYAKLKDTLKGLGINPEEYKWITNMYPEVPLTEFVLRNTNPKLK
ncbi:MAG: hypothetical protein E7F06_06395 [Lachnospiraceae bacterium]|nr:hypothetical protein [Lachnospiraceae bacterium]